MKLSFVTSVGLILVGLVGGCNGAVGSPEGQNRSSESLSTTFAQSWRLNCNGTYTEPVDPRFGDPVAEPVTIRGVLANDGEAYQGLLDDQWDQGRDGNTGLLRAIYSTPLSGFKDDGHGGWSVELSGPPSSGYTLEAYSTLILAINKTNGQITADAFGIGTHGLGADLFGQRISIIRSLDCDADPHL